MQIYNTVKGVKVSIKNGTIKRKRRGFGPGAERGKGKGSSLLLT